MRIIWLCTVALTLSFAAIGWQVLQLAMLDR